MNIEQYNQKNQKRIEKAFKNKSQNMFIKCGISNQILFNGHYGDSKVDEVLDANRCEASNCGNGSECLPCGDTGYKGDIYASWEDETIDLNIYEFINH